MEICYVLAENLHCHQVHKDDAIHGDRTNSSIVPSSCRWHQTACMFNHTYEDDSMMIVLTLPHRQAHVDNTRQLVCSTTPTKMTPWWSNHLSYHQAHVGNRVCMFNYTYEDGDHSDTCTSPNSYGWQTRQLICSTIFFCGFDWLMIKCLYSHKLVLMEHCSSPSSSTF